MSALLHVKGFALDGSSLSLILPVRNVERRLADRVHDIMESIVELSTQLEILIIDDGSTDNTEEVAMELSFLYPQITVSRHSIPLGAAEAANLGVQQSLGEVILIHNIDEPLSDQALRKLWAMRDDEELVIAKSERPNAEPPGESWMDFGTKLLRRRAVDEFRGTHDASVIINRVTRTDFESRSPSPTTLASKRAPR